MSLNQNSIDEVLDSSVVDTSDLDATIEAAVKTQDLDTPAVERPLSSHEALDKAIADAVVKVDERARDEQGRFTAKQVADAAAKAAAVDPTAPVALISPVVAASPDAPPTAWPKDKHALFASLSPEAKAFVQLREQQASEGFKRFEGLSEFAEMATGNGTDLKGVLSTVKQLEDLVAADPIQGFGVLMQRAGFDPTVVARKFLGIDAQGQPSVQRQTAPHPQANQMQPDVVGKFQALERELESLKMEPIKREIATFKADPANKYFDRVANSMAMFVNGDGNLSLKDAYDRACYADPQIRAELLQEQQTAAATAQATKLAQATQTAKRASRGLTNSVSVPVTGKPSHMSVDESIQAALAAQM